jgi:tRNA U34 2-thiouridine synthase MnmA/TrmU
MAHAIALFSGGLDSSLSILGLLRLGVKVTAIHFETSFGCLPVAIKAGLRSLADQYGFEFITQDIKAEFLEVLKKPTFGYGKNMNPCIDCKIMMLQKAGEVMRQRGADCVVTGEVLGQRPMSQQRHIFNLMEKRTGLKGYILRPLSALKLPPTIVETKGLIDRNRLYGFTGRSRKPQMALAKELGLSNYPAPAGGCLLTEPNYAKRLKELLSHNPEPTPNDIAILKFGRHFRLPEGNKVVIGRDQADNEGLRGFIGHETTVLEPVGVKGPLTLIIGKDVSKEGISIAATLCARYSDGRTLSEVEVSVTRNGCVVDTLSVNPSDAEAYRAFMIGV